MRSRLYFYLKCGKNVNSTSNLTRYINAYKIPIILQSCQFLKLVLILNYNIIKNLNLLSDNNKKNLSLKILNNCKKKIRPVDITDNNNKNIRPLNIDQKNQ